MEEVFRTLFGWPFKKKEPCLGKGFAEPYFHPGFTIQSPKPFLATSPIAVAVGCKSINFEVKGNGGHTHVATQLGGR
ncbi:hypothetical protein L1987_87161 [Smallanthus sonchifolius]|nr:hypothetical protein L1987_87161 [Smallanthus sonchifolius]